MLCGCGESQPDPSGRDAFVSRAVMQQQGKVAVLAAVLSDDESSRYFGIALADKGVQAVWLSVENGSDGTLYYLPATTDANYYTPPEASRLFQAWLPSEANQQRERLFTREAMPDVIAPSAKASGFVLTHREGGLKFLRASFVGSGRQFDFRFVIPLDGKLYAAQKVDFSTLPPNTENVDLAGLRTKLEKLPCCAANKANDRLGDPLNLVVIGSDAIFPFIERGWRLDEPLDVHSMLRTTSAFLFGTDYTTAPVSPLLRFRTTTRYRLAEGSQQYQLAQPSARLAGAFHRRGTKRVGRPNQSRYRNKADDTVLVFHYAQDQSAGRSGPLLRSPGSTLDRGGLPIWFCERCWRVKLGQSSYKPWLRPLRD